MPLAQELDTEKPWLIASLAMILTLCAVACLLIHRVTAPVSARLPAARPPYQAGIEQASSHAAEAAPAPAAQIAAEQALAEQTPGEPAAPDQNTDEPTADKLSASEQRTFKVRKALETINPREFLRQAVVPPANILK
jgi:hypothetical protein